MMDIKIIRSRRKTISIQVNGQMQVTVRAPMHMSDKEIHKFIERKQHWIQNTLQKIIKCQGGPVTPYTDEELATMKSAAEADMAVRAARIAPLLPVTYCKISCRPMVSRWGSCSSNGNLSFNSLLATMPEEIREYVAVHELCHRKHMNHSAAFWKEVAKYHPNYKESRKWLKNNSAPVLARLQAYKKQEPK